MPRNFSRTFERTFDERKNEIRAFRIQDFWTILYLVPFVKDYYADENKRNNQLPTRLIGDQAISLSRYGYRLADGLESANESPTQHLRTMVLGRIVLFLRQACTLFNKVSTNRAELLELKECCQLYFNLFRLFFPNYV